MSCLESSDISLDAVLHRSETSELSKDSHDGMVMVAESVWLSPPPAETRCDAVLPPPFDAGVPASTGVAGVADNAVLSPGGELRELGKLSAVDRDGKCLESILFP